MEHRIQFLRDSKGQPVGCVAIKVKPVTVTGHAGGTTLVTYQMSVLNPLDQFDRRMARHLALGRLQEAPLTTTIDHLMPTRTEISRAVMQDIKHDPSAPTRARKAARQWLREDSQPVRVVLVGDYHWGGDYYGDRFGGKRF